MIGRKFIKSTPVKTQCILKYKPKGFCLLTGAPRSGTTALCEWLNEHPQIGAFTESRILIATHNFLQAAFRYQYLNDHRKHILPMAREMIYEFYRNHCIFFGRKLVLDKEPIEPIAFPEKHYKEFLDNVRILIPEAKFIIMVRDPISTIWSMFQREWGFSLTNKSILKSFSLTEHIDTWCSAAEIALSYKSDPNTYICSFSNLINKPMNESRAILKFLGVKKGKPFKSETTKTVGFNAEEKQLILNKTLPQIKELKIEGIECKIDENSIIND